jgi:ribose transport system substrate-binding protein
MRSWFRAVPAVCLVALVAAGCGSSNDGTANSKTPTSGSTQTPASTKPPEMTGPNGEPAAAGSAVDLSAGELAKLKAGHYTVAFVWHTTDSFTKAVEIAARERLQELGIKVVADTVADFDAAKQRDDLETVEALKPNVIVSLPVDTASSASMYRAATRAGSKLVFISNIPAGFKHGTDYVGVVTTNVVDAAQRSAALFCSKLGGKGKIGVLYYDAKFFIVNEWDQAFEKTMKDKCPGVQIAARTGFADPAKADEPASAMLTRYPDLNGIYVSWQDPAVGVLTALRAAGRKNVAVTDVGMNEATALDMVKGGNFIGAGVDGPIVMGRALANEVGYAALGKPAPAFVVTGSSVITRDDVAQRWQQVYGVSAPASVLKALGQ